MDISSGQNISNNIAELNNTITKLEITDIHWLLHPTTADYTFFSRTHGTLTKTDHILDHKTDLNKFKRTEINVCFSDHKGIKLEINDRKIIGKYQNMWRLNKMLLLSNTLVKEEISREILKYFN